MKLINKILVAIDFRESTENTVRNAKMFAKKFNCEMTFMHVLPSEIENEKVGFLSRKAAEEGLAEIDENFNKDGIKTGNPILMFGNYSEKIALAADKIGANLILIGAGEKIKNDSYQLGTTANKVIRESHIPVLVLKSGQDLTNVHHILCPVDFSEESSNALNNAIAITRVFNAKLVILSVYDSFSNNTITRIDPEEVNAQRKLEQELELKRFLEKHNLIDLDYTTEITGGDPAKEILKALKKHKIDLLFIGTTGKSGLTRILLGSVAEKVTREVLCSFVTSKKEDFLDFELKSKDLNEYYKAAEELYSKGFYKEAINLYNNALELNFTHVPSLIGLAKSYNKLGNEPEAKKYKGMVKNLLEQFNNFKIEEEIRKNFA